MDRSEPVLVRWVGAGDRGDVEASDAFMLRTPSSMLRVVLRPTAEKQVRLDALAAMPDPRD